MNPHAGKLLPAILVCLMVLAPLAAAEPQDEVMPREAASDTEISWPDLSSPGHADDSDDAGDDGAPGSTQEHTPSPEHPPLAQSVRVDVTHAVLLPGDEAHARARIAPEEAAQLVEWSSSDPALVSVDGQGTIVAIPDISLPDVGKDVDIWAQATDGSLSMNCTTVRVMPQLRTLKLLEDDVTVSAGDPDGFSTVAVELAPAALSGVVSVEWISSDPSVASVSPAGNAGEVALIQWSSPGAVLITARATDGSGCWDSMTFTVE